MYSNGRQDELEPRPVPKPTQFQEISAKPEVPELSVVFESSESNYSKPSNKNLINPPYEPNHTTRETYSKWKERQNRSPVHKETRYYDSREKNYYGSSTYGNCEQIPYSHFSDRESYKTTSDDYHKCACQNAPTVKDIYNMMQIQNDQIKFLLETLQTLLVTVLSNQQAQHKCCCFDNGICRKNGIYKTELSTKNEIPEDNQLQNSNDDQKEKPPTTFKKTDKIGHKKNKSNISSKCSSKPNKTPISKNKPNPRSSKCNGDVNEKNCKNDNEKIYSTESDESIDLNENDVQVTETPISPDPSIHIEMKSPSSENSTNSDSDIEENNKKIEVGWTMYKNIIGQVNNLLEVTNSEQKSEMVKPAELFKPDVSSTKAKNFEHFMFSENGKIDSSLQMQALAMQYLPSEQAGKFDRNKHYVPKQSPNNYSISTMRYMERYHLIGPEENCNSESPLHKLSSDELMNRKKKSSRKSKSPSKILNITEIKRQPKLT